MNITSPATSHLEQCEEALNADPLSIFRGLRNSRVDPTYAGREDRNRFAADYLSRLGAEKILNIGGGGKRHLQSTLRSKTSVFEIDITGDCDLVLDLDSIDRLPFDDDSFNVCCAFDVLEHLEQFHLINSELFRVARDCVVISLPNSAAEVLPNVLGNNPQRKANQGTFSKFYGLPLVVPEDRHRWWLYFQDIVRFYHWFSLQNRCRIEFWTPTTKSLRSRVFQALVGDRIYYTFFCPHLWIKLVKKEPNTN